MLGTLIDVIIQALGITQSWLNSYLVGPVIAFTRGFEFVIVLVAAMLFFAISVFLLLRQAKKLPTSYRIDITDFQGHSVSIEGIRETFATHDVAESYARLYRDTFGSSYRFRVAGINGSDDFRRRISLDRASTDRRN